MFSVIIPLYNKGSLIKRTIDSVLSQTFQDFEIVVVDDGSTDDSGLFVKEYKDERVKYYFKENGGVSSARNYGIKKSNNEWLVFLDADDQLLPNSLAVYYKMHIEYHSIKYFASKQESKYSSNGVLCKIFDIKARSIHKTKFPFFYLWMRFFYSSPGTMCFHKGLVTNKGYFDSRISYFEDLEFIYRIIQGEDVAFSSEQTMVYNQEVGGLSTSYHPIEKEMAFYIPEMIQSATFWYKALLYENLEQEIYWWQLHGSEENAQFYRDMQKKYFSRVFSVLHWIRQKMIRRGII